jgi:hypothetical protein
MRHRAVTQDEREFVWHQTPPASGHVADWLEVLRVFSLQNTWIVSFKRKKKKKQFCIDLPQYIKFHINGQKRSLIRKRREFFFGGKTLPALLVCCGVLWLWCVVVGAQRAS